MMQRIRYCFLLFILIFAFTSCDDDSDKDKLPDISPGRYEISISGDLDYELEGIATFNFWAGTDDSEGHFNIVLFTEGQVPSITQFLKAGEQPPKGTLTIEDFDQNTNPEKDFFLVFAVYHYETGNAFVFSRAGSITIHESNQNSLIASFEFTALGTMTEPYTEDIEVKVTGVFNASEGEPGGF